MNVSRARKNPCSIPVFTMRMVMENAFARQTKLRPASLGHLPEIMIQ